MLRTGHGWSPRSPALILIFTVVGLFAGLVLMLLRETRSYLDSLTQLADLTALARGAPRKAPDPWLAPNSYARDGD